ncbi:MAG: ABC transporter permease [Novosphingobium sp.]|jgi:phospholipid/cholesterol/gamma-HCH transport system permease protein|nr:MlaE family lipid ABC transporter permease subunit [Novosphingobium sp.]
MRVWADLTLQQDAEGRTTAVLSGPLTVASIAVVDRALREYAGPIGQVDLSGVSEIDTVGAWTVWRVVRDHQAELVGASDQAKRLMAAVGKSSGEGHTGAIRLPPAERVAAGVGTLVAGWGAGTVRFMEFLGGVLIAWWVVLRHPSRIRTRSVVRQVELVGISALGIIGLMSFLVGIVIAQQGAVQLEQFGAEMLTVNLTGRIALRELGVLMTAIMVAGRSGSSFAAQIGTMKLTEEIDAMRTIGVSPAEALILPRIFAAVLMMPLLGFFASVMAIVGGAFISAFTLGIPFMTFLLRIQEVVPLHDVWVGLVKAPFFGLIIALAGCYQGMQVKANAEEVGLRTTMAVVQAIFMVIVLDAFFAVFFTEVGWG